jgi:hypothetical protein
MSKSIPHMAKDVTLANCPGILTAVSQRLDRRRSAAIASSMLYSVAVKTCRSEPACCLTKVWKASALIRFRSEAAASVFEMNRLAITRGR